MQIGTAKSIGNHSAMGCIDRHFILRDYGVICPSPDCRSKPREASPRLDNEPKFR
jgi:hypothetical protein